MLLIEQCLYLYVLELLICPWLLGMPHSVCKMCYPVSDVSHNAFNWASWLQRKKPSAVANEPLMMLADTQHCATENLQLVWVDFVCQKHTNEWPASVNTGNLGQLEPSLPHKQHYTLWGAWWIDFLHLTKCSVVCLFFEW